MFAAERIGVRKAFWASGGAMGDAIRLRSGRWIWDDRPGRVDWDGWQAFKRHRRNWSEHRKVGKLNRKRLRRESRAMLGSMA